MGVAVLPPDVNASDIGFTVERLGAAAGGPADESAPKGLRPPRPPARARDRSGSGSASPLWLGGEDTSSSASSAVAPSPSPLTSVPSVVNSDSWAVRFGLLAIKNVGSRPIEELLEARRGGSPFTSLADLFARTDSKNLTRGAVECLIKAGACDNLGRPDGVDPHAWRSRLLHSLDRALSLGQQQRRMREIGQHSLFGGASGEPAETFTPVEAAEYPRQQILAWEKELLNLYLSAHPLAHVAAALKKRVTTYTSLLTEEWAGQRLTLGGRITEVRRIMTKKGDAMAAVQLEDMQGAIEVVVFPKTYAATADRWQQDAVVLVTGSVSTRNDEIQLVADEVEVFEVSEDEMSHRDYLLRIRIARGANDSIELARLDQVYTVLSRYPGDDRFELLVRNGRWEARLTQPPSGQGIRYCPELMSRLEEILGPNTVEPVPLPARV